MPWTQVFKHCATALTLLSCTYAGLGVAIARADQFHWSSASHQPFEADFNQDGYPDLLLHAKTNTQQHYLLQGNATKRYDMKQRIQLASQLDGLAWSSDKMQLVALRQATSPEATTATPILAISRSGDQALLLQMNLRAKRPDIKQIYPQKRNPWLQHTDKPRYFSGDFDGDGSADLLQIDEKSGEHQVILAAKNQTFKVDNKISQTIRRGLKHNERLIIRDFNRDGQDDIFALSRHGKQPNVLIYSNGKGGFNPADIKRIAVIQAGLQWSDASAGIMATTRKSDNQVVLFRAYNSAERKQSSANCLGWVYDTEAGQASEYCPAPVTGSRLSAQSNGALLLNDCPIEMSVTSNSPQWSNCGSGTIVPNTPTAAPQVNYGPHAHNANLKVSLANTQDDDTFIYELWAQHSHGDLYHLGDVVAPHWSAPTATVALYVTLPTSGTFNLMYRGCHANGCSGFGPASTVAIYPSPGTHTVSASAAFGGTISPKMTQVEHGQTAVFQVTPNPGYIVQSILGCHGVANQNPYVTGAVVAACNIEATFAARTYRVSTSTSTGGTIDRPYQDVLYGQSATFQITPHSGYTAIVTGCGGSLMGTRYQTGPISNACTVTAAFSPQLPNTPDPLTRYDYDARGRLIKMQGDSTIAATYLLDNANNRLAVTAQTAPPSQPTITSFSAPATVAQTGSHATISWASSQASHCALQISGATALEQNLPQNGTITVSIGSTTGVTLTCYNGSLSAAKGKIIRVGTGVMH